MKDAHIRRANHSLVADVERKVPDIIWGGAEGEAQERLKKHEDLLDEEARQTGVVIR